MSNGRHFNPPTPAYRPRDPFSPFVPKLAENVPSCEMTRPLPSRPRPVRMDGRPEAAAETRQDRSGGGVPPQRAPEMEGLAGPTPPAAKGEPSPRPAEPIQGPEKVTEVRRPEAEQGKSPSAPVVAHGTPAPGPANEPSAGDSSSKPEPVQESPALQQPEPVRDLQASPAPKEPEPVQESPALQQPEPVQASQTSKKRRSRTEGRPTKKTAKAAPERSAKASARGRSRPEPAEPVAGPGEEVRICEWEKCRKKFIVKATGRRIVRRFCSGTCRGRASEARTGKR
ncbi:MAG: hypothetical protein RMK29_18760 [Myxococcales bacterium]|nr:hypothetical protein [Myxococcota bacterium]MDW8283750.1 hypothetical protein [Myxococcales bacterium]